MGDLHCGHLKARTIVRGWLAEMRAKTHFLVLAIIQLTFSDSSAAFSFHSSTFAHVAGLWSPISLSLQRKVMKLRRKKQGVRRATKQKGYQNLYPQAQQTGSVRFSLSHRTQLVHPG